MKIRKKKKCSNVNMKKLIYSLPFMQAAFLVEAFLVWSTDDVFIILLGFFDWSEGINI